MCLLKIYLNRDGWRSSKHNTGLINKTQLDGLLTTLMLKCSNKTVLKNKA